MSRTTTAVGLVLVVAAAGAGASAAGVGFLPSQVGDLPGVPGDAQSGSTGGDDPRSGSSSGDAGGSSNGDSASDGGAASSGSADDGAAKQGEPFAIGVVSIETCGRTCRDVTLRVTNRRNRTMHGVGIHARIFAGKGTDGKQVWTDAADISTMEAGGSRTLTRRVTLGYGDAFAVKNNGGWVTVETRVTADSVSATFTEQRDVL